MAQLTRSQVDGIFCAVIRQEFGNSWVAYHGDSTIGMRGLPGDSIHFSVYSPPFLALYIYSDSIADLGNTESEEQFFEGYRYSIKEQFRVIKPGRFIAVHCKDTMRYMSSHSYAGLYDFPGQIIQNFEAEGFLFHRWITIWKDPVVEMQRTKTYGLLHKSFKERAEVTRQGCADFVLVFQKPHIRGEVSIIDETVTPLLPSVLNRVKHQWSQEGEEVGYNQFALHLSVWSQPLSHYDSEFISQLSDKTQPGRLAVIHCQPLKAVNVDGLECKVDMMGEVIQRFQEHDSWKFHSRCALTDGTHLVVFRNWTSEFKSNYQELNGIVSHDLKAPRIERYKYQTNDNKLFTYDANKVNHPDYVGNNPPTNWHDDGYYSILVWQRYASPVWFDLDGLPPTSLDCWMDIDQTDVLNARLVKEEEGEKHICPLQLDLISQLIEEYTQEGEIVMEPYLGIGSTIVQAIRLKRRGVGFELKGQYFDYAVRYLKEAELSLTQVDLFSMAGVEV